MPLDMSPVSWIALGVMVAAVALALSKKFLATGALVGANVAVYLLMLFGSQAPHRFGGFSASVPDVAWQLALHPADLAALHPQGFIQLFSSMFVHDWLGYGHIVGNMIFLLAYGLPFESRIGPRKFVAIYLLGGLGGTLAQVALDIHSPAMQLGASGAISAIMGAFAARFPGQVIGVPVPLGFIFFIRLPVWVGTCMFIALQLLDIFWLAANPATSGGVAYAAHFGGLATGALLGLTVLRKTEHPGGTTTRVPVDLDRLATFARDEPTQRVLVHMRANHDEPEVFQAWLDRFFRTATCPTCGHRVFPQRKGEVRCTQGHLFDVRLERKTAAADTPA
jgi:membrane associated rhomboid family serine protease